MSFDEKLKAVRKLAKAHGLSFKRVGIRNPQNKPLWMFTYRCKHKAILGPMTFDEAFELYKGGKIK